MALHSVGEIFGNTIGDSPDLHRFLEASGFGNKTADFGKGAETWPRGYFLSRADPVGGCFCALAETFRKS